MGSFWVHLNFPYFLVKIEELNSERTRPKNAKYGGQSHPSVIRRQKNDQYSTYSPGQLIKPITIAVFRH